MFLKNKNIIFEIRRSKVTDYAALITYLAKAPTSSFSHIPHQPVEIDLSKGR